MSFEMGLVLFGLTIVAIGVATWWLGRHSGQGDGAGAARLVREEFRASRSEAAENARRLREEVGKAQQAGSESLQTIVKELGKLQQESLNGVEKRVKELAASNEARLDKLRETIDKQLKLLQESNEKKLEQMRTTVDEKLQSTLEKRLGESFKLVSERLEAVQRGLGDMQNLATGVGDLKRVLTNVKARGTWGEYQIGDILEQILTPDQYQKNVQPKPDSSATVEYAVKLPGKRDSSQVWLPIDAKFPQEDYQRLLDAADAADKDGVESSTAALVRAVQNAAKDIKQKYVEPPYTTDFAIMFLPTEGLYAEVLRQPGMIENLQRNYRIVVAGPTTLSAILNSLRMGFRTLAIEKRSSEVWEVLAAVKTEFGKFGNVLKKVKKQLAAASNTIDDTGVRTRAMERQLRDVESLPSDQATDLLGGLDGETSPGEETSPDEETPLANEDEGDKAEAEQS
ncbi:MAG: DNA recombination protein RmuC [Pseudohongiellaceae bacterium]